MDDIGPILSWTSLIVGMLVVAMCASIIWLYRIFSFHPPAQVDSLVTGLVLLGTAAFVVGSIGVFSAYFPRSRRPNGKF